MVPHIDRNEQSPDLPPGPRLQNPMRKGTRIKKRVPVEVNNVTAYAQNRSKGNQDLTKHSSAKKLEDNHPTQTVSSQTVARRACVHACVHTEIYASFREKGKRRERERARARARARERERER